MSTLSEKERQAIIEALHYTDDSIGYNGVPLAVIESHADAIMNALSEIRKSNGGLITDWIKVEDSLPPVGKRVLFHGIITWKSVSTPDSYFDDILTSEEEGLDYGVNAHLLKDNSDYLVSQSSHIGEVCDQYITEWKEIESLIPTNFDPKTFDIDCAGNVMLRVEITDNVPTVLCAMNGYGNAMEVSLFSVNPVEVESDETKEAEPKEIPEGSFRCSRCGKSTHESKRAWEPFTDMCQDCAPF